MRDGTAGPGTPPELLSFGDWAAIATASRDAIEASPLVAAASLKDETDEVKKLRDEIKWVWPKVREHVTHCGVLIGRPGSRSGPTTRRRRSTPVIARPSSGSTSRQLSVRWMTCNAASAAVGSAGW
jgi:hypothetical protein